MCDHSIIFLESFGETLDLQSQFLTENDDLCSWRPFYNVLLKQTTLDNLHVYSRDLLECIPEIPRQLCCDLDSRKIHFNLYVQFQHHGTP